MKHLSECIVTEQVMNELAYLIYARDGEVFWTEDENEADSFEAELIKRGIKYEFFYVKRDAGTKFSFEVQL